MGLVSYQEDNLDARDESIRKSQRTSQPKQSRKPLLLKASQPKQSPKPFSWYRYSPDGTYLSQLKRSPKPSLPKVSHDTRQGIRRKESQKMQRVRLPQTWHGRRKRQKTRRVSTYANQLLIRIRKCLDNFLP